MKCPLLKLEIACQPTVQPWCDYCASRPERKAEATVQPAPEKQSPGPHKQCVDCGKPFPPASNRQERCPVCATGHNRGKNAEYQRNFRGRKKKRPEEVNL